ncbi:MAG: transposase [Geminicoccaceae bacterium]
MRHQKRFAKEFEIEAVQLVQTSGRTQREVAADLGVGLPAFGTMGKPKP